MTFNPQQQQLSWAITFTIHIKIRKIYSESSIIYPYRNINSNHVKANPISQYKKGGDYITFSEKALTRFIIVNEKKTSNQILFW